MAVAVNVQAVQGRLAHHYLEKLRNLQKIYERGGDSVYAALTQFEQEWPQIQRWQAWAVAHAQDDPEAAVQCYEYPVVAFDLLNLRQNPQERIQWLETGLAAAHQLESLKGEADILLAVVSSYDKREETGLAEEYAQQALTLAYQLQDQHYLGQAFRGMGDVLFSQGKFAGAQENQEQALAIFQSLGDRRNVANCLHRLGNIQRNLGNYQTAAHYLEQCVAIRQRLGDVTGLGITLANLGLNACMQGEYTAARDDYERSLALAHAVGDRTLIAGVLTNLGMVAHLQGDLGVARQHYEESLAIFEEIGNRHGTAILFSNMAIIASDQADDVAARRYQESALDTYRSLNSMSDIIAELANLTLTLIRLGELEEAVRTVHEGVILVNHHPGQVQINILVSVAQLFIALDRFGEAAVLAGLALHHPTAEQQNRDDVEKLRPDLEAALGADAVNAAFERGKTLDLQATLADLLPKLEVLL
jgi:tetratricopeptide (TPR) repeat protein